MKKQQKTAMMLAMVAVFIVAGLFMPGVVCAGGLDPPAGPDDPGSAMYTLEDIYNYLDTGVAGSKREGGFVEPTTEPGSTGHTLDDVHVKIGERCITCVGTLSPEGRWCDMDADGDGTLDGTVKDMTTGLVWLKDAGWGGEKPWRDSGGIDDAHTRAGILQAGSAGAGLSDGSVGGDWRLPTKSELVGITQGTEYVRSGTPRFFTNVQSDGYWSSTAHGDGSSYAWDAWYVLMYDGDVDSDSKAHYYHVWPVRPDN